MGACTAHIGGSRLTWLRTLSAYEVPAGATKRLFESGSIPHRRRRPDEGNLGLPSLVLLIRGRVIATTLRLEGCPTTAAGRRLPGEGSWPQV